MVQRCNCSAIYLFRDIVAHCDWHASPAQLSQKAKDDVDILPSIQSLRSFRRLVLCHR